MSYRYLAVLVQSIQSTPILGWCHWCHFPYNPCQLNNFLKKLLIGQVAHLLANQVPHKKKLLANTDLISTKFAGTRFREDCNYLAKTVECQYFSPSNSHQGDMPHLYVNPKYVDQSSIIIHLQDWPPSIRFLVATFGVTRTRTAKRQIPNDQQMFRMFASFIVRWVWRRYCQSKVLGEWERINR